MSRNDELFARAQRSIPGGVNSPVRAFRQVGGTPRFFERGAGARLWDADGREYIDYVGSWGPMILGHAHPTVVAAVQDAAAHGLGYGAPTEAEIVIAEEVMKLMPSLEKIRFVSSGTEAAMSAIRLARGATGRTRIVKFDGCYHGHADSLLVKAGSGLLTFGNPTSAGVPADFAAHTIVLDYNDIAEIDACFEKYGHEIACVIVEPIAGNMNFVRGTPEWHARLRELCTQHGSVLIWDEVMTGFRVALGGAQSLYGIRPDLTVLGKVIGGGMPVAAFGGSAEVMKFLAPEGPVYQAGTLSGNPVAVAAGLATLRLIQEPGFHDRLGEQTAKLMAGFQAAAESAGLPLAVDSVGGMFGFYFREGLPGTLSEVHTADVERFKKFFHAMLDRGVYLAPSAYEAGFVSAAHDGAVVAETLVAAAGAFRAVA